MSSQSMKTVWRAASLIVPTLVLCVSAAVGLAELSKAPTVRLPVAGYDPVDLLHGHYIQFRFDNNVMKGMPPYSSFSESDTTCVCLHRVPAEANGQNATIEYVKCAQKPTLQCEGWTSNAEFFNATHKYFVDERYASQLDKIVREATPSRRNSRIAWVGKTPNPDLTSPPPASEQTQTAVSEMLSRVTLDVAISSSGSLQLKMLNIDNKPWVELFPNDNKTSHFD